MSDRRDADERTTRRKVGAVVLAAVAVAAVVVAVSYARRFEQRRHAPNVRSSSSASAGSADR